MDLTKLRHIAWIALLLLGWAGAHAQDNDMILNRPYADSKPLHFGFSVGMNFQNLAITNNGFVMPEADVQFWKAPMLLLKSTGLMDQPLLI